jgi:hypothetical protein
MFVNCVVALSNLVGIALSWDLSFGKRCIVYAPMIASFIYHLSETKHGLVGLYPLNKYSLQLLWIDRFFAFASGAVILYRLFNGKHSLSNGFLSLLAMGSISLFISEKDLIFPGYVSKTEFMISHSFWHYCAFEMLVMSLK